jgi:hypothetical protein
VLATRVSQCLAKASTVHADPPGLSLHGLEKQQGRRCCHNNIQGPLEKAHAITTTMRSHALLWQIRIKSELKISLNRSARPTVENCAAARPVHEFGAKAIKSVYCYRAFRKGWRLSADLLVDVPRRQIDSKSAAKIDFSRYCTTECTYT